MTDFSAYFIAKWKAGQMPQGEPGNTVVTYDQTSHAYNVAPEDRADFAEWVAQLWETDNDPRDDGEAAADYLDRIGATIRTQ